MPTQFQNFLAGLFGGGVSQPAANPPGQRTAPANAPSSAEISRAVSGLTMEAEYTIRVTGAVEIAFSHIMCVSAAIFAHGGEVAGEFQPAQGTIRLSRVPGRLTVARAVGDHEYPEVISETATSDRQSARYYVKGTAGDKLTLVYRP